MKTCGGDKIYSHSLHYMEDSGHLQSLYPLDKRSGGPLIWSGHSGKRETSRLCQEMNHGPVRSLVPIAISYRLINLKAAKLYFWRKF
jgi:hypothetical protein